MQSIVLFFVYLGTLYLMPQNVMADPLSSHNSNRNTATLSDVTSKKLKKIIATKTKYKPVLINLWATWCGPCLEELPAILKLRKEYATKFEVVLVSMDFPEHRSKVIELLNKFDVDFESWFKNEPDEDFFSIMPNSWGGALPYTMMFNKKGELIFENMGGMSEAEFRTLIEESI